MKKIDIDIVMSKLKYLNFKSVQNEGILLAENIKNLKGFFQPYDRDLWENCAKILYLKSDDDLFDYIYYMFEWLQDMNWAGAMIIAQRLKKFKNQFFISECKKSCINKAIILKDSMWKYWLENYDKINVDTLEIKKSDFYAGDIKFVNNNYIKIDDIIEMLDCKNNISIQNIGMNLAKEVKNIQVFFMPLNKNTWENCARIIAKKNYSVLKNYLNYMLEWISDSSVNGFSYIMNKLEEICQEYDCKFWIQIYLKKAVALKNKDWENNLKKLSNLYKDDIF